MLFRSLAGQAQRREGDPGGREYPCSSLCDSAAPAESRAPRMRLPEGPQFPSCSPCSPRGGSSRGGGPWSKQETRDILAEEVTCLFGGCRGPWVRLSVCPVSWSDLSGNAAPAPWVSPGETWVCARREVFVSGVSGRESLSASPLGGGGDRKSTRLNSSHRIASRMPSSA